MRKYKKPKNRKYKKREIIRRALSTRERGQPKIDSRAFLIPNGDSKTEKGGVVKKRRKQKTKKKRNKSQKLRKVSIWGYR